MGGLGRGGACLVRDPCGRGGNAVEVEVVDWSRTAGGEVGDLDEARGEGVDGGFCLLFLIVADW